MLAFTHYLYPLLYSPFHSDLPFEPLGKSSLCVNHVTFLFYFGTETVSLQHLFLGYDVTLLMQTL